MFVALALIFAVSPFPDPWAGAEAPQVVTVSEGETVDLVALATPGQYTIVDVGAAWCAPCHDAARALRPYLEEHPDVVVRAVTIAGQPWDLAKSPAAAQLLGRRGQNRYFMPSTARGGDLRGPTTSGG
ncbi:MAG: thioredoxin family protein [Deltaproteobacteria bacterium]|nr:thioredoxin family protein [Deltaproteobacteria bacterium]